MTEGVRKGVIQLTACQRDFDSVKPVPSTSWRNPWHLLVAAGIVVSLSYWLTKSSLSGIISWLDTALSAATHPKHIKSNNPDQIAIECFYCYSIVKKSISFHVLFKHERIEGGRLYFVR